jgi:hypothetical protein
MSCKSLFFNLTYQFYVAGLQTFQKAPFRFVLLPENIKGQSSLIFKFDNLP